MLTILHRLKNWETGRVHPTDRDDRDSKRGWHASDTQL